LTTRFRGLLFSFFSLQFVNLQSNLGDVSFIDGMIRFSGFFAIKSNLTEPNRFGLNQNSVRFGLYFKKFKVLGSVGFCGSNRIEPNHEQA
jgi:hypothetical protein